MDRVVLGRSGIETSRLGFGCARLLREPSARKQQILLEQAVDCGITHFDVARMYGMGAAEGALGTFAAHRRSSLVIATKFGIAPLARGLISRSIQSPFRAFLREFPLLKTYARRAISAVPSPRTYTPESANRSLHASLRSLRTDYVDIFLLHEPRPEDRIDEVGLVEFFQRSREAGKIRGWGISGTNDHLRAIADRFPAPPDVVQVSDEFGESGGVASVTGAGRITFGVLRKAVDHVVHYAGADAAVRLACLEIGAGSDLRDSIGSALLQIALDRNETGTVLFSSTRDHRIRLAAAAAARQEEHPELAEQRHILALQIAHILRAVKRDY